jgi:hypothetical protein
MVAKKKAKKWIQKAIKKPGALHKALKVPAGKKIPPSKLAVKESDSPTMKKRKNLAKTLSKLRKGKK